VGGKETRRVQGRLGFPKFRSKHSPTQSFRIPQRIKVRPDSCGASNVGEVYCPKVGWIRFKNSRDIPEDASIKGATFKRDAVGDWHVTITAVSEVAGRPLPPLDPETTAGLDAGFKDFIVSSNGERVAPPKHYRRGQKKLRRAQRVLSRRKKGSNKRRRAKKTVARNAPQGRQQTQGLSAQALDRSDGKTTHICIETELKGWRKPSCPDLPRALRARRTESSPPTRLQERAGKQEFVK
jgi:putative transposase